MRLRARSAWGAGSVLRLGGEEPCLDIAGIGARDALGVVEGLLDIGFCEIQAGLFEEVGPAERFVGPGAAIPHAGQAKSHGQKDQQDHPKTFDIHKLSFSQERPGPYSSNSATTGRTWALDRK